MTPFEINVKKHHVAWCEAEFGRMYDLIMTYPDDIKGVEKWHARMTMLSDSAEKARRELRAAGITD